MDFEVTQDLNLPRYGKRNTCQGNSKNCPTSNILCVFSVGIVFPFHSEDEVVAHKNLKEAWTNVGRTVISRR